MVGPSWQDRPRATVTEAAYLVELLAAHGAVLLVAENSHLGGAAVANGVVAFSYRENLHFLTTQDTGLLGFLGD